MTRRLDLRTYLPGIVEDIGAFGWYLHLVETGELGVTLGFERLALGEFFRLLAGLRLWYLSDATGWWAVAWTAPLLGGATYGLWIRRDHRQSPSGLVFTLRTLDYALTEVPVLVNTCQTVETAARTVELGYTYIGMVPGLVDGKPLRLLHLTRDAFDRRWPRERYAP